MYCCWLCGEELEIGATWCSECSALQNPPPDRANDVQPRVDGKLVSMGAPVGKKPYRPSTSAVA